VSTQPQTATPSLEQFVRDDVIEALMGEGFTRSQAEAGAACGAGITFSELFRSSLNWLMGQRRNGRPMVAPKKESPVQTQTASIAKPNGHHAASLRICKCGCGEEVPAANRFSYINGHRSRKILAVKERVEGKAKCGCGRPLPHRGLCEFRRTAKAAPVAEASAPPVAARVALEVTEAQLNQFLVKLSLADKQRLANHFLQTAEG
jgi:hypothetical protein